MNIILKYIYTSAKEDIGVDKIFELSVDEADRKEIIERFNK